MNILLTEYNKRKNRNPAYSLRAFAKALNLSPGHLSLLISGKRALTYQGALKLVKALGLSRTEEQKLLSKMKREQSKGSFRTKVLKSLNTDFYEQLEVKKIPAESYLKVAHWHFDAIFNLCEINQPLKSQITTISTALKLSKKRVTECFDSLNAEGVITIEEKVIRNKVQSYAMDGNRAEAFMVDLVKAFKLSQTEIFELGMACMRPQSPKHLLTSHCFSIPNSEFGSFAQTILSFGAQLDALYKNVDTKEDSELYFFSTQTVPVTQS